MSSNQHKLQKTNLKRKLPKLSELFSNKNNVEKQALGESLSTDESHSGESPEQTQKQARKSSPSFDTNPKPTDENQGDGSVDHEAGEVPEGAKSLLGEANTLLVSPKRLLFQSGPLHRSKPPLPVVPVREQNEYDPDVVLSNFFQKWYEKDDDETADVPVTWLLVAGGDPVQASNLLLRRLVQFGVSRELLVENGYDYSHINTWITSMSVDLIDAMCESMVAKALVETNRARQQPMVQLNTTIETLVDLSPNNVKKLCDKLLVEARNGAKRNIRALFDGHIVEAITDQLLAMQMVRDADQSNWLEKFSTESICKMLVKAFPLDSAAKAITINLMDQLRAGN